MKTGTRNLPLYSASLLSAIFIVLGSFPGWAISPPPSAPTIPFNSEGRVTQLVRQFNEIWKRAIETMNGEVMKSFSNFRNGTQILQVIC